MWGPKPKNLGLRHLLFIYTIPGGEAGGGNIKFSPPPLPLEKINTHRHQIKLTLKKLVLSVAE